ncbi:MAG: Rne/Rng family ribonuclease [Ancrocorticia sp.]|jgi:ribonuclease E|nr:Rne/Rng family ribonuclease [Ancrocorticia sp.]
MADQANESARAEQAENKQTRDNQLSSVISDAVAQSLAELESSAARRPARKRAVRARPEVADALLSALDQKSEAHAAGVEGTAAAGGEKAAAPTAPENAHSSESAESPEDSDSLKNAQTSSASTDEVSPQKSPRKSKRAPRKKSAEKSAVKKAPASAQSDAQQEQAETVAVDSLVFQAPEPQEAVDVHVTAPAMTALLFQEPDVTRARPRRRRTQKAETDASELSSTENEHDSTSDHETREASLEGEGAGDTAPDKQSVGESPRRRRGSRGRGRNSDQLEQHAGSKKNRKESSDDVDLAASADSAQDAASPVADETPENAHAASAGQTPNEGALEPGTTRRRRRRRSSAASAEGAADEVAIPKGSTRLEAKRQRRKEGRDLNRRRHTITEAEYLARRESVKREMLVREQDGLNQIAVLEDDVLVEHYVARHTQVSMVGNVYLGRVQNVLPSMEAAFVDIGKGRNAVLYAGEVNWEAAGLEGKPRRIEQALQSGDTVVVQVTKDPIGQKGARLTAQITLAGRHLVLVPSGAMTGISRKLPDKERQRLKKLLREIVPPEHGVIVRTAAEGATEEQLRADVERLTKSWESIQEKAKNYKSAPTLLKGEPELAVRVVRDIFNEDFSSLTVQGDDAWRTISAYVNELSPELSDRLQHWTSKADIFAEHRVDEQLAKAFDRKVWLPSGGTLIIDRTEAMTVIDVNTGKFTGSGGTLEETVTRNNLEAAEEIVRQLRLRDIGGIIVIDFIDMVLESNRELVLRRLVECLGRDRTRHQVAEVTSLGLIQMTRKRVGQGLVEAFSTPCEVCEGRGFITHTHPVEKTDAGGDTFKRKRKGNQEQHVAEVPDESKRDEVRHALNSIAAAAAKEHDAGHEENANRSGETAHGDAGSNAEDAAAGPSAGSDDGADKGRKQRRGNGRRASSSQNKSSNSQKKPARKNSGAQGEPPSSDVEPRRAAGEVVKIEPVKGELVEAPTAKPRARRVSSAGTITPGSGTGAILSFPAQ